MTTKRKTVAKPRAKRVENLGKWKPVHVTGDKPKIEITMPESIRKPAWRFDVRSALIGYIAAPITIGCISMLVRWLA